MTKKNFQIADVYNLFNVINQKDVFDELETILKTGIDVNEIPPMYGNDFFGNPNALIFAITRKCSLKFVRLLVQSGADITFKDKKGKTAIDYARQNLSWDIVEFLSGQAGQKFTPIDQLSKEDLNALLVNALAEFFITDYTPVDELLKLGADINARDKENKTPLLHAVFCSQPDMNIQYLLDNGADYSLMDEAGDTAVHIACRYARGSLLEMFMKKGADINYRNKQGETLLHTVMKSADWQCDNFAKVLLSKGADVTIKDISGKTPADVAINNERRSILTAMKATDNADKNETSLHWAITNNNINLVKNLVEKKGARIHARNYEQYQDQVSALHVATKRTDIDIAILKYLVEQPGTDINIRDMHDDTPLHYAMHTLEKVKLLVEKGADVNAVNEFGETPFFQVLSWDKFSEQMAILDYLVLNGADKNIKNKNGRTLIAQTAYTFQMAEYKAKDRQRFIKILRFLLDKGFKPANENLNEWKSSLANVKLFAPDFELPAD
jgi:ankyrin repeat protein